MDINSQKEFHTLLKQKGFTYRVANQGWTRISCPTCSPSDGKKMKRYVNPAIPYSHCFICQEQLFLNDLVGDQVVFTGKIDPNEVEYEHPQAREFPFTTAIPVNVLPSDHPAIKFLQKDHFTDFDELYDKYWVYYIPMETAKEIKFDSGAVIKPGDSLVFPLFFNNELVGWQCRFVPGTPNGDKYTKMKYFMIHNKGKYLYNFDEAKKSPFVVVFEGIKKAWKYPAAGVSTLGKGITTQQIQLLQNNWKKIIFFLDGDDDAQEVASVHHTILQLNGRECRNIDPRTYGFKSPDEMTHAQVKEIIENYV